MTTQDTLNADLLAQIKTHFENIANLAGAVEPQIAQAAELSQKLCSAGLHAEAYARFSGHQILIWVTARPTTTDHLNQVLTRLDLQESSSTPSRYEYELRLHGYAFPIYIYTPDVEAALFTKIEQPA